MTPAEELKLLFKQHRWAVEELACDQKMQEVNALCSSHPRHLYDYLHHCYGSNAELVSALKSIIVMQQGERRKTLHKGR
jgi:hypothetical protein